jgi:hypothetical protein
MFAWPTSKRSQTISVGNNMICAHYVGWHVNRATWWLLAEYFDVRSVSSRANNTPRAVQSQGNELQTESSRASACLAVSVVLLALNVWSSVCLSHYLYLGRLIFIHFLSLPSFICNSLTKDLLFMFISCDAKAGDQSAKRITLKYRVSINCVNDYINLLARK